MHEFINHVQTVLREYNYGRKFPHLRKLELGQCQDVYLSSNTRDAGLNTNIKAHLGMLDEMSWGFKGTGGHTLAMNLLYTFTMDASFARLHALDFRFDFLEVLDWSKSHIIHRDLITAWIESKQNGAIYVQ